MNWGKGIAITLVLFITFITVLVVNMISTKVDLVNEDYYAKEVGLQDEIDAQNNINKLAEKPSISTDKESINFFIPQNAGVNNIVVNFYRPSDENGDKTIRLDDNKSFSLNKSDFEQGNYEITLNFDIKSTTYTLKQSVYL